jgi:hypothetical protein
MKTNNKLITGIAILVVIVFASVFVLTNVKASQFVSGLFGKSPNGIQTMGVGRFGNTKVSDMTEDVLEALLERGYFSLEDSLALLKNEDPAYTRQLLSSLRANVDIWMKAGEPGSTEGMTDSDRAVAKKLKVDDESFMALKVMLHNAGLIQEDDLHGETIEALKEYARGLGMDLDDLFDDDWDDDLYDDDWDDDDDDDDMDDDDDDMDDDDDDDDDMDDDDDDDNDDHDDDDDDDHNDDDDDDDDHDDDDDDHGDDDDDNDDDDDDDNDNDDDDDDDGDDD